MKRFSAWPFLLLSLLLMGSALAIALTSPRAAATALVSPTPTATLSIFFPSATSGPLGGLLDPLIQGLFTPTSTATASLIPTATQTVPPTRTSTPTLTFTPTVSATRTRLPTSTATATLSPTPSRTATASATPTVTSTPAALQPARLFPMRDGSGRTMDWSYQRITSVQLIGTEPAAMQAFLGFQLMDRAIHSETIRLLDKDLTIYYLNAAHQFEDQLQPVRVILSGEWGRDISLAGLSTSGSFFVRTRLLTSNQGFDAFTIHREAAAVPAGGSEKYQDMFIRDLEAALHRLPQELILMAEGPVLVDPDVYPDVDQYFANAPYLAARYWPWVSLDDLGHVKAPSDVSLRLADHLYHSDPLGSPPLYFSSSLLVLISPP